MPVPMHEVVSQVAHSNRNENRPASVRPSDASGVDVSRVTGRPQFTSKQKPEATPLVSATVYLLPEKLELIKRICAGKNRRISDFISEAIDDSLARAAGFDIRGESAPAEP
jgi:hypothetical protein